MDFNSMTGVGLRIPHHHYFLEEKPPIGWLEVHSENYFLDSRLIADLVQLSSMYPISLHGVGLSLGSADPLDRNHLSKLKVLAELVNPIFVSEHMSWSSINGMHFNDLLPLPYTAESLRNFVDHVDQTQQTLGRQILIENPSSYICFNQNTMQEWEFYAALPDMTGCGLLLDINNLYVTGQNQRFNTETYLSAIPFDKVNEIHMAGHTTQLLSDGSQILIDTHGSEIADPVWALYTEVVQQYGARHTLVEWDTELPDPDVLINEASKLSNVMRAVGLETSPV